MGTNGRLVHFSRTIQLHMQFILLPFSEMPCWLMEKSEEPILIDICLPLTRLKSEIQELNSIQARRSLRRFCFPCGVLESMDGGLRVASALATSSSKPNNSKICFLNRYQGINNNEISYNCTHMLEFQPTFAWKPGLVTLILRLFPLNKRFSIALRRVSLWKEKGSASLTLILFQ